MEKKVRLYIRISPTMKAKVAKKAKAAGISITDFVESVLSAALKTN